MLLCNAGTTEPQRCCRLLPGTLLLVPAADREHCEARVGSQTLRVRALQTMTLRSEWDLGINQLPD